METILIVDDAPINREILKKIFEKQYRLLEAGDGEEAIRVIDEQKDEIDLVLLDLMMPKKNGLDVLSFMKKTRIIERVPVIMITGEATLTSDLQAYQYGAADIVYKPFEPTIVKRRARNVIDLYLGKKSIEHQLEERTRELRESQKRLAKNNEFLINALGSVVEFRSTESGEHVQRVKDFTRVMMNGVQALFPEYGLRNEQIEVIAMAAALHDVGKIAIPDAILGKPGKLTAEEFAEMKTHTVRGCEILEKFKQEESEFYKYCYEICRWHHEKYDGKGYPDGLVGEDIPIWAQAVAVADCFDALVSKRVYKEAYAAETAFDMIQNGECGAFSEKMMKAMNYCKQELMDKVKQSY